MPQADGGGCLHGCLGFVKGKNKTRIDDSAASGSAAPSAVPLSDAQLVSQIEAPMQEMISEEMKGLEESISRELQGVLSRLLKVDKPAEMEARGSKFKSADEIELASSSHNRTDFGKRRWTAAADGADGLAEIIRRGGFDEEAEHPSDSSSNEEFSVPSSRNSIVKKSTSERPVERSVSFGVCRHPSFTDDTKEEASPSHSAAVSNDHSELDVGETSSKSGSSAVFHADSLDFGDRLAATAAAKKGNASVDSIVELVQTERERWGQEKLSLEARLDELKQIQQKQLSQLGQDPEKEALKVQVQELRDTMKARSRFGAWVCERHMDASDDEEEDGDDKEQLREQLSSLQAEVRKAKVKGGSG